MKKKKRKRERERREKRDRGKEREKEEARCVHTQHTGTNFLFPFFAKRKETGDSPTFLVGVGVQF